MSMFSNRSMFDVSNPTMRNCRIYSISHVSSIRLRILGYWRMLVSVEQVGRTVDLLLDVISFSVELKKGFAIEHRTIDSSTGELRWCRYSLEFNVQQVQNHRLCSVTLPSPEAFQQGKCRVYLSEDEYWSWRRLRSDETIHQATVSDLTGVYRVLHCSSFSMSLFQLELKRREGLETIVVILQKVQPSLTEWLSKPFVSAYTWMESTSNLPTRDIRCEDSAMFSKTLCSALHPSTPGIIAVMFITIRCACKYLCLNNSAHPPMQWPEVKLSFKRVDSIFQQIFRR